MQINIGLAELGQAVIAAFSDPKKRVFWGYLLSALVVALGWMLLVKGMAFRAAFSKLFQKRIWWSASARLDYLIFLINKAAFLLLAPLLLTQLVVATWLFEHLHQWLGYRPLVGDNWSDGTVMLIFTVSYLLLDDFSRFYLHKLLHEVPALWVFHKLHHSARTLTPITVFRTHPVEGVLFALRAVLVQGICIGLFVFLLGSRADLITVLGASVFAFLFNMAGANLRHSHVAIGYWRWLEKLLISPAQHQIHHSVELRHFNKNYGVILSVWDWCFGSGVHSQPNQTLEFGLSRWTVEGEQNLKTAYWAPFVELYGLCCALIGKYFLKFRGTAKE